MAKIVSAIILVLVALAGSIWYFRQGGTAPSALYAPEVQDRGAPSQEAPGGLTKEVSEQAPAPPAAPILPASAPVHEPMPAPVPEAAEMSAIIRYTDTGFVPASLTVKKGTAVTFRNESVGEVWPASARHPTHTVYPTSGGCLGSTFDACRGLRTGEEWTFSFDIAGTWGYHDHLTPRYFGSVTVER